MASKSWKKHNSVIEYSSMFILAAISRILLELRLSWPAWLAFAFIALIWIVGVKLTFILNDHFAKSMVRTIRLDYDLALWEVQRAFRNNNIWFSAQIEEDVIRFKFREPFMILTIEPYVFNFMVDQETETNQGSKVTLHRLNTKNKAFAVILTEAIDEMAHSHVG
jgi:hypothetical protein